MSKKVILKIGALVLVVLLIGFIIFIANYFLGNPISNRRAKSVAKKYIAENYSDSDLKVDRVIFNFKDGGYYIFVVSEKSVDTHFSVGVRNGKIFNDDYDYTVASGQNTIDRLCKEYEKLVSPLLKTKIDKIKSVSVLSNKSENYGIPLDADFDKNLVTNVGLSINIQDSKTDVSSIAKFFGECYNVLAENGYSFTDLSITCENSNGDIMEIKNVKPSHIQNEEFEKILLKAIENHEYDGITTFGKSIEK